MYAMSQRDSLCLSVISSAAPADGAAAFASDASCVRWCSDAGAGGQPKVALTGMADLASPTVDDPHIPHELAEGIVKGTCSG